MVIRGHSRSLVVTRNYVVLVKILNFVSSVYNVICPKISLEVISIAIFSTSCQRPCKMPRITQSLNKLSKTHKNGQCHIFFYRPAEQTW